MVDSVVGEYVSISSLQFQNACSSDEVVLAGNHLF
jgi:hypothetical protein